MSLADIIGQTRDVCVYRILAAKTYEMHMFHSASVKLGLDRAVLEHQRQNTEDDGSLDGASKKKSKSRSERQIQAKEIDEILKKGYYYVFRNDNDTEAQQVIETYIDQLLEQSSQTVTYGSYGKSNMSSGMGSFSKASFVVSTEDGYGQDVDLDDPDLQEKDVGLEDTHESIGENGMKVLFEKISRNQVKVYSPYAEFSEVYPEPAILLLLSGTALNEIIR